ncbi:arsenate reductase family protein [uncultured Helicobacter sp.]|uniref:arsenate reductase family protein n=1 Tax=uncultured Helicobacter sp. TaxID=175537 RepID=UPI0026281796|nr:arsenate reductase family protein [uncultured Helicobacter sp.]
MVKVYGIKNCGSVRKALKFLDSKGIEYKWCDFKITPPTHKNLEYWLESASLEVLLNKKGTTYRKLGLKDLNLTEKEIKEWLIKEPMLIKRPIIEYSNGIIVGFDEDSYQNYIW